MTNTTKDQKAMTAQTAIDLLREMQRQVIGGRNTFGEIADVVQQMSEQRNELLHACELFEAWCKTPDGMVDSETIEAIHAAAKKARGEEGRLTDMATGQESAPRLNR